jgi:signal transduction histidine kinase/CheY-like chemotaxis protein
MDLLVQSLPAYRLAMPTTWPQGRPAMNFRGGMSKLACSLVALTFCLPRAQAAPPTPLTQAGLAIFDTPSGWRPFVSGGITAFARSGNGVLFIGSNRLAFFDGHAWGGIDVPGGTGIRCLTPSNDGRRIWVGGSGMVGFVEQDAASQWVFTSMNPELAAAGETDIGDLRHIHLEGGRVVFVSRQKVARWNPPVAGAAGHFELWNLPSELRLYTFSDGDTLFIYQTGVGLLRMEAEGPRLWLPEKSLPARPPMAGYISLPSGQHYAVFNDGIFRHDQGKWIRLQEASDAVGDNRAQRAVALPDGEIVIGTSHGGCILLRPDGSVQRVLNLKSGLTDVNVDKLWVDAAGQLWIGMWTGLARFSSAENASLYDQRVGFGPFITRKVFRLHGEVDAVTSLAVYALTPGSAFDPANFVRKAAYFRLQRDAIELDGQLWIAGSDGLWKVTGDRAIHEPAVSTDLYVLAALRALPHGLILFGQGSCQAWLRRGDGWMVKNLSAIVERTPVSAIEDREGRLWVSTQEGQIHCFAWDNATETLRTVAGYWPGHGVPSPAGRPVMGLVQDRIFAFIEDAVLEFDSATGRFSPARQFDGLIVAAAATGPDGTAYWITRQKDLGALASLALLRVSSAPGAHGNLTARPLIAPGLDQVGAVNSLSVTAGDGGDELWVGGESALLRLATSRLSPMENTPPVALRSLRVNSAYLAAIAAGGPVFASTARKLEFGFSAGAAGLGDENFFYQTKLDGVDREWSTPQAEPRQEFARLSPGSYVFNARAVDRFGQAGPALRYPFTILTPWYRTPLALAAWVATGVLLAWGGLRWRLRRLHAQAERLNQLVNERTRELSLSSTAKSEFLENISHEIRNPLNGITGLIRILDETGLSSRQREHARALKECSEGLSRVFDEVLSFSKLEYGYVSVKERAFLLGELLESVRALFLAEAGAQAAAISLCLPAGFADGFWGDDAKIKTIVVNFVGNALKYAPGRPVEISVSCLEGNASTAGILIEVTDHGPGVPSEEQELIFKKFVRGSGARQSGVMGSGIGLATCRAMARLLGGSVGIESHPGQGATFFVRLPLRRAQAPTPPSPEPDGGTAQPAALIVDDQHYNRLVHAGMAEQLGYRTVCACDIDEAIAAASHQPFAIAFIDVELPGARGPEIAQRLRALPGGSDPLLIGASANDSDEAAERCRAAGMDGFLVKPFTLQSVRNVIAEAQRERSRGQPSRAIGLDVSALEFYAHSSQVGFADATKAFLQVLHDEIAALAQAVRAGEPAESVWRAAHRVRSHAAIAGVVAVAQAAASLEQAGRSGDLHEAGRWLEQIQAAAAAAEQQLTSSSQSG